MNRVDSLPSNRYKNRKRTWTILLIVVIVIGIFFRSIHLDRKIFWFDETYTALRISGHTDKEFVEHFYTGSIVSLTDIRHYQISNPNKGLHDTVNSVRLEDPYHPPLYYILLHFWVQKFGSSVSALRSLSTLFSILMLPAIYWLALELFQSVFLAQISLALIAVSPFHVLYAQEARYYSFWALAILISSASLLRAMRLETKASWLLYIGSITIGLYINILTILIVFSHGIYILVNFIKKTSKAHTHYVISILVSLLLAMPLFIGIIHGMAQVGQNISHMSEPTSLTKMITSLVGRIGYVFIDVVPYPRPITLTFAVIIQYVFGAIVMAIILGSFYNLTTKKNHSASIFILSLACGSFLPLIVPSLILGGSHATINRYLIPFFLAIQLSIVYFLGSHLKEPIRLSSHRKRTVGWSFLLILLFTMGIMSCVISSQSIVWWNKGSNFYVPQYSAIINQANKPLIISDSRTQSHPLYNVSGDILSLSHNLKSDVRFQLTIEPAIPNIPKLPGSIFLFNPSENLKRGLQKNSYKLIQLYATDIPVKTSLWQVEAP
jgi:uncharacterized membrane protein